MSFPANIVGKRREYIVPLYVSIFSNHRSKVEDKLRPVSNDRPILV